MGQGINVCKQGELEYKNNLKGKIRTLVLVKKTIYDQEELALL